MSTAKKFVIKPIIITKKNTGPVVISQKRMTPNLILSNLQVAAVGRFREDVIYESSNCDFLRGDSQQVRIVNKVNVVSKTCRTIAKCTSKDVSVETTSDAVCALIGQNNYDTVLSALGSVFNEETKVRGILSLLTKPTQHRTVSCQTKVNSVEKSCQTMEVYPDFYKPKRRRMRKQNTPYVVKEITKCIIDIGNIKKIEDLKTNDLKKDNLKMNELQKDEAPIKPVPELIETKPFVDEDSNISCASNISSLSIASHPELLDPKKVEETLESIRKTTCALNLQIKVFDGTDIMIPVKPEDSLHIATPDILKNVTSLEGNKLRCHQAFIDYNLCLTQNEDNYYPIHMAVLHNDLGLLRRQCLALAWRKASVDQYGGRDQHAMTPLQMSVHHNAKVECTRELLQRGADPLLGGGAERRSALHIAAAAPDCEHLTAILDHCDRHPRQVLKCNQNLWNPKMEAMTDTELMTVLYDKVSEMTDSQGNTPLMLAAGLGRTAATLLLGRRVRVDAASPGSGDTALYRAAAAACLHVRAHGGTDNIPEHFLRTAETLVSLGADPTKENHSGSSVNSLLQETTIAKLSMCIVNAMSQKNHGRLSNMILIRDKNGTITPEDVKRSEAKSAKDKKEVKEGKKRKLTAVTVPVPVKGIDQAAFSDVKRDGSSFSVFRNVFKKSRMFDAKSPNLEGNSNDSQPVAVKIEDDSSNEIKPDTKPNVVIVENVSYKDFPKINIPTSAVTMVVSNTPKDIVFRPNANVIMASKTQGLSVIKPSSSKGDESK